MALIYAENFKIFSLTGAHNSIRFGGPSNLSFSLGSVQVRHESLVPYLDVPRPVDAFNPASGVVSINQDDYYATAHLPNSKNVVIGLCLSISRTSSAPTDLDQFLQHPTYLYYRNTFSIIFRSIRSGLSTRQDNFAVTLDVGQFLTFGRLSFDQYVSGAPAVPVHNFTYDFSQPFWLWVQCDMNGVYHGGAGGTCRVWINEDLIVTRQNIYTGNPDTWSDTPSYALNNAVLFRNSHPWTLRGLAATNEDMLYMDSALGDINITTVKPQSAFLSQWGTHRSGVDLDRPAVEVLGENATTDLGEVHTVDHARASEHLSRDIYGHELPFDMNSHIIAAAHNVAFKKHVLGGDSSKLRIEPIIYTESRDPHMQRNRGKFAIAHPMCLHVPHTIPYAGAFWNTEILGMTGFGFAYYDAVLPEYVPDDFAVGGEYDVENLESGLEFRAEPFERSSLLPQDFECLSIESIGFVERIDWWYNSGIGVYSDNWDWPHAGRAGVKITDTLLAVLVSTSMQMSTNATDALVSTNTSGVINTQTILNYYSANPGTSPATEACVAWGGYLPDYRELTSSVRNALLLHYDPGLVLWSSYTSATSGACVVALGSGNSSWAAKNLLRAVVAFRLPDPE